MLLQLTFWHCLQDVLQFAVEIVAFFLLMTVLITPIIFLVGMCLEKLKWYYFVGLILYIILLCAGVQYFTQ